MSAIEHRIARLEQKAGNQEARQIVLTGSVNVTSDQIDTFLAENGVVVDHGCDQIVYLQNLFEGRPGQPAPSPAPLSLVAVHQLRG